MIHRGYADTRYGQLHYATCGTGEPVLLLHQTPRSWDEYREVLPILGDRYRAIAMDTLGFGASAPGGSSIVDYAGAAVALLDALDIARCAVVGHHTGAVIALEIAASAPQRVRALVLSCLPWVDGPARRARAGRPAIDAVTPREDGTHLTELWQRRAAFYPPRRPDLLHRFVRDALAVSDVEAGHRAVSEYRMEHRIGLVGAPTMLIGAPDDPYTFGDLRKLRAALPDATVRVLDGGRVPLPDQLPGEFALVVAEFLERA